MKLESKYFPLWSWRIWQTVSQELWDSENLEWGIWDMGMVLLFHNLYHTGKNIIPLKKPKSSKPEDKKHYQWDWGGGRKTVSLMLKALDFKFIIEDVR